MDVKSELFLKQGIYDLFEHIKRIRYEIAAIQHTDKDSDKFTQISDELDAIVESTEEATNTILESVEGIDDIITALLEKDQDDETSEQLNKIYDFTGNAVVACSFQDITGQRVTKVVKSLQYVEDRINALVDIWGKNDIKACDVINEDVRTGDAALLNGPQLKGEGVTQDDVDSFFNEAGDDDKNEFFTAKGEAISEEKAQAISLKMQEEEAERDAKKKAKKEVKEEEEEGEALAQDDIDSLFD